MKSEHDYQAELKKKLLAMPFVWMVTKQDAGLIKGIPDLVVYVRDGRYAWFEVKRSYEDYRKSLVENPLQQYYILQARCNGAFASYIYPEIEEEVLNEFQQAFEISRDA